MGGPCEIRLFAETRGRALHVAQNARARIEVLEHRYTRFKPDSLTSRINQAAGTQQAVAVDTETEQLLDYAHTCWQQSDGLFDITSGVLRRAWDFKSGRLPEQTQIDALLPLIGWQSVERSPGTIRLPRSGMEIDFGGVVKEYAADCAVSVCLDAGLRHGLIDMAGDIRVVGPQPGDQPWRIGLRNPRAPEHSIRVIDLHDGGLASSGDYERFMIVEGQRYCHVLNPKTGWPVRGTAGISVMASVCMVAGTAATIAMLKQSDAHAWLDALSLPYVLVREDLSVVTSR